ncbi:MAG: DivIVA domain-containing protein [Oscillospiraceae bacterium]|nr:DivIVA domain-containing protein [Oscillospiraceae bacterium]
MITPQQIHEISFDKVRRGGYDMDAVDQFLEPLTEDYITLYKENSVLKSKMRILVEKLEEYRKQETAVQSALLTAQKTCEQMTLETEKKCAKMLREAEETAGAKARNAAQVIGEEEERMAVARASSQAVIDELAQKLEQQLALLNELRTKDLSTAPKQDTRRAFDFNAHPSAPSTQERADALIEEIGQNVESALKASEPLPQNVRRLDHTEFTATFPPGK